MLNWALQCVLIQVTVLNRGLNYTRILDWVVNCIEMCDELCIALNIELCVVLCAEC